MSHWSIRLSNILCALLFGWLVHDFFANEVIAMYKLIDMTTAQQFSEVGVFGKFCWLFIIYGGVSFLCLIGLCIPFLITVAVVYVRDYNFLGRFTEYSVGNLKTLAVMLFWGVAIISVLTFFKELGDKVFTTKFRALQVMILICYGHRIWCMFFTDDESQNYQA